MDLFIDHHVLSGIIIFGTILDFLGALYLAYDLFEQRRDRLLRPLTELVTIGFIGLVVGLIAASIVLIVEFRNHFSLIAILGPTSTIGIGLGYGAGGGGAVGLGYAVSVGIRHDPQRGSNYRKRAAWLRLVFAVVVGLGVELLHSLALAVQSTLVPQFVHSLTLALIIGIGLGVGVGFFFGLSAGFLVVSNSINDKRPGFDKVGLVAGLILGLTVGTVAGIVYWITFGSDPLPPIIVDGAGGLIVGATIVGPLIGIAPIFEWKVYTLRDIQLGTFGLTLVILGFAIQSLQYWVSLLDIPTR